MFHKKGWISKLKNSSHKGEALLPQWGIGTSPDASPPPGPSLTQGPGSLPFQQHPLQDHQFPSPLLLQWFCLCLQFPGLNRHILLTHSQQQILGRGGQTSPAQGSFHRSTRCALRQYEILPHSSRPCASSSQHIAIPDYEQGKILESDYSCDYIGKWVQVLQGVMKSSDCRHDKVMMLGVGWGGGRLGEKHWDIYKPFYKFNKSLGNHKYVYM